MTVQWWINPKDTIDPSHVTSPLQTSARSAMTDVKTTHVLL